MKVLNVMSAKSIWLFDINDLNPRGKDIGTELLDFLKDNYHFEKVPTSLEAVDEKTNGLKFERGRFQIKEEIYISVDLEIFKDGIVGNTRSSTKDTDEFLSDVLQFSAKEFSLPYSPDLVTAKMHVSELNVRMDAVLFDLNPNLVNFANTINSLCGVAVPPYEVSGLVINTDIAISRLKPAQFVIERKVGVPFDEKRYYSRAPVHTDEHERLLGGLEHILSQSNPTPATPDDIQCRR